MGKTFGELSDINLEIDTNRHLEETCLLNTTECPQCSGKGTIRVTTLGLNNEPETYDDECPTCEGKKI